MKLLVHNIKLQKSIGEDLASALRLIDMVDEVDKETKTDL
jgi:hypothetical protein